MVAEGEHDRVALNDIRGAITSRPAPLDELLALVSSGPMDRPLPLGGRDTSRKLVYLPPEVQPVEHPPQQGISARWRFGL